VTALLVDVILGGLRLYQCRVIADKRLVTVGEGEIEAGIAKIGVIQIVKIIEEGAVTQAIELARGRGTSVVEYRRGSSGRVVHSVGLLVRIESGKKEALLLRGEQEVGWQGATGTCGSHHEG
jgi:hypothetical protein